MTELLQRVIAELEKLPEAEQNAICASRSQNAAALHIVLVMLN